MENKIVTEVCPHCENEVSLMWDVKKQGYKAFCPVCGERLMLCSECLEPSDEGCERHVCDYSKETDSCQLSKRYELFFDEYASCHRQCSIEIPNRFVKDGKPIVNDELIEWLNDHSNNTHSDDRWEFLEAMPVTLEDVIDAETAEMEQY